MSAPVFTQYGGLTAYETGNANKNLKVRSVSNEGFSLAPSNSSGPLPLLLDTTTVQFKYGTNSVGTLQQLPVDIAQLRTDLTTEEARARAAEVVLDNKIAFIVDNSDPAKLDSLVEIVNKFNADGVTFGSGLTTLTTNLSAEVTRALAAEGVLSTAISDEVTRASDAEGGLSAAISDEVTRATNAEGDLSTAITNEVTRATNAEGDLSTAITNEVTRASGAEGDLSAAIGDEVTRASNAEGALRIDLDAEVVRASSAEGELSTAISNEQFRATNAEGVLRTAISAEASTRNTAISAEATNRSAEITIERNARIADFTQLSSTLSGSSVTIGNLEAAYQSADNAIYARLIAIENWIAAQQA